MDLVAKIGQEMIAAEGGFHERYESQGKIILEDAEEEPEKEVETEEGEEEEPEVVEKEVEMEPEVDEVN